MRISDWSSDVCSSDLADAFLESGMRPDAFDDHHAAPHAIEQSGMQLHGTAVVAEPHSIAIADPEVRRILRMDKGSRPLFATGRGRRLGERSIEEVAGRRGDRKSTSLNSSH